MGFFRSIASAVYREYDRRIKRASLVTEYGAHHAAGGADAHAAADEEAEIVNVPRGTLVPMGRTAAEGSSESANAAR